MNASNPGRSMMNAAFTGTPGATVPVTITLPCPLVTQGAIPLHACSSAGFSRNSAGEEHVIPGAVDDARPLVLTSWAIDCNPSTHDWSGRGHAGSTAQAQTFRFDVRAPSTGFAMVSVRLDSGLEGDNTDDDCSRAVNRDDRLEKRSGNAAAKPGTTTIRTPSEAARSCAFTAGSASDSDQAFNVNSFKSSPGVDGHVRRDVTVGGGATQAPAPGRLVKLFESSGDLAGTGTSDGDGCHFISCSHRGSAATCQVKARRPDGVTVEQAEPVTLSQGAPAEVNFTTVP